MDGNFIVQYQKYPIKEVYEDFCTVEFNGNTSCINYLGELLMPFTSEEVVIHNYRYAEAKYEDLKMLYDLLKPKLVLVEKYNHIIQITDSLIVIRKVNGTIDLFNHDSLKLNNETIEDVTFDVTNNIVAKTTKGWIIYDNNANIIFKDNERRYSSVKITNDGYISLTQMNQNNYPIYGLADMNGEILLPCYSDSLIKVFQDSGELFYILKKYKKVYICNSKGDTISSKYDFISKGREGICIGFNGKFIRDSDAEISGENGTFHAISLDGHVKFTIRCQYLYSFRNGYATIKQDYHYGKVNTDGVIVIPPKYESIGTVKCGLIAARKYGMWGYLDESNNTVIRFEYDMAEDFDEEGKADVSSNGAIATINTKGELLTEWEQDPDFVKCSSYDSIDEATYIKDGLEEAFNGDPSNYWNID
ncbi:MAG: WG repeat-containing protein [Bacteroidales bacterium]|nr:WG repeat-containing protein [Bacteroidales bacterium]